MKNKEIEELLNELKKDLEYQKEVSDIDSNVAYLRLTIKKYKLLLSYMEQLENLCNKYEQEQKTTFKIWKEDIKKSKQLENNRDKAIEYVEKHTDKLKNIIVPKIDFDYKELLNKLKGDSDE